MRQHSPKVNFVIAWERPSTMDSVTKMSPKVAHIRWTHQDFLEPNQKEYISVNILPIGTNQTALKSNISITCCLDYAHVMLDRSLNKPLPYRSDNCSWQAAGETNRKVLCCRVSCKLGLGKCVEIDQLLCLENVTLAEQLTKLKDRVSGFRRI